MSRESRFVGVLNPVLGARYIDLSKVVAWILNDQENKLIVCLMGGYAQEEDTSGDADYVFYRDKDKGFDVLVLRLKSMSENLWDVEE